MMGAFDPFEIYSMNDFSINSDNIDRNLEKVRQNGYSTHLFYLLQVMLNPEMNRRENTAEILNNLRMAQQEGDIIIADRITKASITQQNINREEIVHQSVVPSNFTKSVVKQSTNNGQQWN